MQRQTNLTMHHSLTFFSTFFQIEREIQNSKYSNIRSFQIEYQSFFYENSVITTVINNWT